VFIPDDGLSHQINMIGNATSGAWLIISDDGNKNPLPEDLNGDGVVNVHDLLLLIAAWGATSP
jgi:hypothetical protein